MEHYRVLDPHDYLFDQLTIGSQPDGRSLTEFRPISLQTNLISSSHGSSLVRLGDAVVVTSVKGEIVDDRTFFSAAENDNFSSETYIFESIQSSVRNHAVVKGKALISIEGQPHFSDAKTNEISKTTSVLQTLLDENKIVDLNDLAIGVSAALHATNLPCVTLVPEGMELDSVADAAQIFPDKISVSDTCRSLKCTEKSPLTSCSFLLLDSEKSANQEIIVSCDPIEFEINLFPNNILTLIIGESKDNGKPQIYGVYKYGGTCLANEETFDICLNLAAKRKLELNNLLDQALTHR